MRRLVTVGLGVALLLSSATSRAGVVPDMAVLQDFAAFGQARVEAPARALDLADSILARTEDSDLRLAAAQIAIEAGAPQRALDYLAPLAAALDPADPRAAAAFDLADRAHAALGDAAAALESALAAYNAAEARLGPENPALLARLDVLEPRIRALSPALLPALDTMRATIVAAQEGKGKVRAEGDPAAVTVWYGTNRTRTDAADPAEAYGTVPGPLSVGTVTVTIPPGHLAGLIERPTGWFFTEHLDPKQHVVLAEVTELARDAFADGCCGADDRLLFIHGYNVSFHDGALRAAQLSFDLEFRGRTMYYSWPSQASLLGYLTDASNVVPSRPAMVEFLEMATRGSGKLHIIAHSMGNRYTLEALEAFLRDYPDRRLGQVVLAAPDVDRAEFAVRFPVVRSRAEGVTLYASKNDMALLVSRQVNGGYRAGDASGEPVRLAGLDTIDASSIEADTLGHSYFGDAPQVLADILGVVRLGWMPGQRCGVTPREVSGAGALWEMRANGCPVEEVRAAGDLLRLHGAGALAEAQRRLDAAPGDELDFWRGVLDVVKARLPQ